MKPFFVVLSIFAATAFCCSSLAFAEESPRPISAPGGETARELQNVTQGKKFKKPAAHRKAKVESRRRWNPEDVGC